ncbi:hypothetical protein N657DRAFT_484354 [Parathielavia appendiculata]|uniref:Uncharacterized protein n=1 Tax=Parathielavia appendiculata TaxID=2587402 RepID=A0AAN6Z2T2_9PEZI|nr:hypothetical protein N657DRAFT_484354 [Parathielavia appendiculata]
MEPCAGLFGTQVHRNCGHHALEPFQDHAPRNCTASTLHTWAAGQLGTAMTADTGRLAATAHLRDAALTSTGQWKRMTLPSTWGGGAELAEREADRMLQRPIHAESKDRAPTEWGAGQSTNVTTVPSRRRASNGDFINVHDPRAVLRVTFPSIDLGEHDI